MIEGTLAEISKGKRMAENKENLFPPFLRYSCVIFEFIRADAGRTYIYTIKNRYRVMYVVYWRYI